MNEVLVASLVVFLKIIPVIAAPYADWQLKRKLSQIDAKLDRLLDKDQ